MRHRSRDAIGLYLGESTKSKVVFGNLGLCQNELIKTWLFHSWMCLKVLLRLRRQFLQSAWWGSQYQKTEALSSSSIVFFSADTRNQYENVICVPKKNPACSEELDVSSQLHDKNRVPTCQCCCLNSWIWDAELANEIIKQAGSWELGTGFSSSMEMGFSSSMETGFSSLRWMPCSYCRQAACWTLPDCSMVGFSSAAELEDLQIDAVRTTE